jgi:integrase
VTPRDINRILDGLGPTSKDQALRSYSAFFNWCVRRHYLDTSPCARMVGQQSTSRSRVLTDEELPRIWRACEEAIRRKARAGEQPTSLLGEPPPLSTSFCTIVKLLILTGQRRGEIAALQSSWIKDDTIIFPSTVTKNGREHVLPMGAMASTLIAERSKSEGNERPRKLLLPSSRKSSTPISGWSKLKLALDRASGVTGYTLHDIRRTYRTIHARIGTPPHIAERLVNHVSSRSAVEAIYDRHTYLPEMRAAVERYEAYLISLLRADSLENGPKCQRRSKNASVCRSKNTSVTAARRPRTGGLFVRHQAWVGLSAGASKLARRERCLL